MWLLPVILAFGIVMPSIMKSRCWSPCQNQQHAIQILTSKNGNWNSSIITQPQVFCYSNGRWIAASSQQLFFLQSIYLLGNYGLIYSFLKFCFLTRLYIPWIQEWSLPVLSYLHPLLIWYKYGAAVRSVYSAMPVARQRSHRGPCISAPWWGTYSYFCSAWFEVPLLWIVDKDQS